MRPLTFAVSAAALCATIVLGALPAVADDTGTLSDCAKYAEEVDHALANNPQADNHEAAVKEQMYGRGFCANGLYSHGVEHYEQALKLLGDAKN